MQRRQLIKLVLDHVRVGTALKLNDQPHAAAITRFIDHRRYFGQLLVFTLGLNLFDDRVVLGDLVGQLLDDQHVSAAARFMLDLRTHGNPSSAGRVGLHDARSAMDDPAGREVRPGDDVH